MSYLLFSFEYNLILTTVLSFLSRTKSRVRGHLTLYMAYLPNENEPEAPEDTSSAQPPSEVCSRLTQLVFLTTFEYRGCMLCKITP
jgi:hypothetical protein